MGVGALLHRTGYTGAGIAVQGLEMKLRRSIVVCLSLLTAVLLWWPMHRALAPGGWTVAKATIMGSFALATLWVGLCFAQGVVGGIALLFRPRQPAFYPVPGSRIAIAVTVRNEDMGVVLPPLRRLLDGLDAAGAGDRFALFVLSDSTDTSEERAIAAFRTADRDPERIRYRRRTDNERFKAGNIMEFLDHRSDGFGLMLVLDADSDMSAHAALRLAHEMEANPHLAIVQHLTVGLPAASAFPRLFQFGMRAGMRTWAAALAWWQGDEACYWGHNAMIRIAPFRVHARLPLLPDGRPILSHDQIEAALLAGAGWGVRLLPEEDGSFEATPPALPEFMRRELRWLAGNLEYRFLLRMPGLRPMGRWQLVQAILLFGCTPFYLVILVASAVAAATDHTSPFPAGFVLTAMLGWAGAIYAPKLLGYAQVLCSRDLRAGYGGLARVLAGIAAETVFTLLLDAISVVGKSGTTLRLLLGLRPAWLPQNRRDRGVSWAEAARLLWPHTAIGILAFAAFASAGWNTVLWAAPLASGLVLAIPFCVLTANPRFGAWLQARRIAATPEEIAPRVSP
jgi:membrane glycosyltransferase